MEQPASTTLNLTSGLGWQARNSSVGDGNENSDADSRDVEPNDQSSSETIGRLIHEGNNGISMNPSPVTPTANSFSSPIATEPDDHLRASERTDVIVHEGFGNIAVGSAPFTLGNPENEPNPAELKLANEIVERKLEIASLRSRVEQLEQSHSENSLLKSQIDQQQKEFLQLKQVSSELQLGVCKRDMLNENQRMEIVQLSTECDQLQLHCDKLNERMETLEREHQLAQEKSAELQTELDKRNEENMRQIDAIKQLTLRLTESEVSAKKNLERISILEKKQVSLLNQNHKLWKMTEKGLTKSRMRVQQKMPGEGVYENQLTNQRNSTYSLRAQLSEFPYIVNFRFKSSAKFELFIKDAAMDCYYAVFPAHVILESNCFGDEEKVSSLLPPQGTEMSVEISSKELRIVDKNPKFILGRQKHLHRELVIDIAAANVTQQKSILHQLVKSRNGELFWPTKILQLDEYAINFLIKERVRVYLKGKSEVGYICRRSCIYQDKDDGFLWVVFEKDLFCANDSGTIMYVKDKDNNPYMLSMLIANSGSSVPIYGTAMLWYNIQELCKEMNIMRPTAINDDEVFVPCDKKLLYSLKSYKFH